MEKCNHLKWGGTFECGGLQIPSRKKENNLPHLEGASPEIRGTNPQAHLLFDRRSLAELEAYAIRPLAEDGGACLTQEWY